MRHADLKRCPFCAAFVLDGKLCPQCGQDIREKSGTTNVSSKTARYEVVPDGTKFGIALQGMVKIHGMDLERARSTATILNEVLNLQKAS